MVETYLSLGSNLGDREGYLQYACGMIDKRIGVIMDKSSVYESSPWGFTSDNFFYNQVLCVSCNVEADELLHLVQQIEREAGRERLLAGYADRTLDIDILFYGDRVVTMPGLTIPHPHMTERRFVLEPLCELAPDFIHPVLKLPLHRLLEQCKDSLSVRKLNT